MVCKNVNMNYLPGQAPLLHGADSISSTVPLTKIASAVEFSLNIQSAPPNCGNGSLHKRVLVMFPSPHAIEQLLQLPQDPQFPSTIFIDMLIGHVKAVSAQCLNVFRSTYLDNW